MKTYLTKKFEKKRIPYYFKTKFFFSGNVVLVIYRYKRIEVLSPLLKYFLGICLSYKKHSYTSFMILRNHAGGEGLEFNFNVFSPCVLALKKVKLIKANYNKCKIYYLRNRIA